MAIQRLLPYVNADKGRYLSQDDSRSFKRGNRHCHPRFLRPSRRSRAGTIRLEKAGNGTTQQACRANMVQSKATERPSYIEEAPPGRRAKVRTQSAHLKSPVLWGPEWQQVVLDWSLSRNSENGNFWPESAIPARMRKPVKRRPPCKFAGSSPSTTDYQSRATDLAHRYPVASAGFPAS